MKLPGAETQAPVTTLADEVELLELDELLDMFDELEELDRELLELVDDEDELMLELLERELALTTELALEFDEDCKLDALEELEALNTELATEEELAALELTMLLTDDALATDEELFTAPTDELVAVPCDPLQALNTPARIRHKNARLNIVSKLMVALLPNQPRAISCLALKTAKTNDT